MDERKISLAITTHQEFEKTIQSFAHVIDNEKISDITIVDDFSDELIYWKFTDWLQFDAPDKIKLCRNVWHIGEHLNKRMAILMADEEYVLLMDSRSDVIYSEDVDIIFSYEWDENMRLQLPFGEFICRKTFLNEFDKKEGDKLKILK